MRFAGASLVGNDCAVQAPTVESRDMQTTIAEISEAAARLGHYPRLGHQPHRVETMGSHGEQPPRREAIPLNLKVMIKDLEARAISFDLRRGKEAYLQHIRLSDLEIGCVHIGSSITFEDCIGILRREAGAESTQPPDEQPRAARPSGTKRTDQKEQQEQKELQEQSDQKELQEQKEQKELQEQKEQKEDTP